MTRYTFENNYSTATIYDNCTDSEVTLQGYRYDAFLAALRVLDNIQHYLSIYF